MPAAGRLIDPTLFVELDGELRLAGSRCDDCATVTFPAQASCPRCTGQHVRKHALASTGALWASTVQRFAPKTPYLGAEVEHRPYGVGYVDLGGEVLVESRLVGDVDSFHIGMQLTLTLDEVPCPHGQPIWSHAFVAVGGT